MSERSPRHVVLAGETDLDGFRQSVRGLLADAVAPERVSWSTADGSGAFDWSGAQTAEPDADADGRDRDHAGTGMSASASAGPDADADADAEAGAGAGSGAAVGAAVGAGAAARAGSGAAAAPSTAALVKVPAAFVELCQCAILHSDPRRFGLLYRLLWRLLHEPGLRRDPLDADRIAVRTLAQAVRRDLHKMKAFVRFRELRSADAPGAATTTTITHITWFEPEHHIVEAAAPFFASRFANLRWAILTPARSVRWDGERLAFGPGARREEAPPAADAGERLWLTYYEHIFNPARLKLAAMQKEMPRRYWPNLPEARLIEPLAARAAVRSEAMVAREAALPRRRLPQTSVKPRSASAPGRREDAGDVKDAADAASNADDPSSAMGGAPGAARALAALRKATDRCRECPIGEHATQSVLGEGPPGARLMLVGEQPGDQEDLRGRPFVGPAGQLLDRALAELGWPRDAVYVTNAVKHFKFELRGVRRIHKTPGQREAAACLHWLESEIEQVRPQAFVALGATAARSLLGRAVGVTAERGRWLVREDGRRVLITLHPSALLRLQTGERQAAYALWLADLAHATELIGGG